MALHQLADDAVKGFFGVDGIAVCRKPGVAHLAQDLPEQIEGAVMAVLGTIQARIGMCMFMNRSDDLLEDRMYVGKRLAGLVAVGIIRREYPRSSREGVSACAGIVRCPGTVVVVDMVLMLMSWVRGLGSEKGAMGPRLALHARASLLVLWALQKAGKGLKERAQGVVGCLVPQLERWG